MRQNYFAAPKVPASVLTPRKCEDEEIKSRRRKERKTRRDLREREKLRTGGKERRARLAAGGSNCVINLKVRFSREDRRRERERNKGGKNRRERERERERKIARATSECCRSVFAAESA